MAPETLLTWTLGALALTSAAWLAVVMGLAAAGHLSRRRGEVRLLHWLTDHRAGWLLGATCTVALSLLPRPAGAATGDGDGVAVMVPLSPPSPAAPAPEPAPTVSAAPAAPPTEGSWTVETGDHLWHIATATLIDDGLDASDTAIANYVGTLVEWNRGVLADPTNPDLIYPGQVLRVR